MSEISSISLIGAITRGIRDPKEQADAVQSFITRIASGGYQPELQAFVDRIRKDLLADTDTLEDAKFFIQKLKPGEDDNDVRMIQVFDANGSAVFTLPKKALKKMDSNNALGEILKTFVSDMDEAEFDILLDAIQPIIGKKRKAKRSK